MDKPLFSLITLKEAEDFIDSLAPAVVRKIFFNIDCLRFGIKTKTLLLLLLTDW